MCNNLRLPQLMLVIILAIEPGESRTSVKLPEPPQDGAAGLHLHNGLDDCGKDSHSSCDSWAKSGECEKDPEVKQSCSFSCSLSGQLWEAAWTGELSAVETTLVAGANPLCTKFIEYGRGYPSNNYTAIHMAASAGHPGIVNKLMNAGVDVNLQTTKGKTPIYIAVTKGNIDAVDILIENNANVNIPDYRGITPLGQAAMYGMLNIARALIQANASLDVTRGNYKNTALYDAINNYHTDLALLLIEHNANINIPDSRGMTPLMQAARRGELNIARALIKANASIDVTGGRLDTSALYYAVCRGNQDIALLLIEHCANVNIPDPRGMTPLMAAAEEGQLSIAKALISANASLDVTGGGYNATALHYAVEGNNQDIALLLIEHNANVNIPSSGGLTALHYAVEQNNHDVVVLLMDNGADSSITNKSGFTPSDLARLEGHNQLADLIESYPTTHRLILSR